MLFFSRARSSTCLILSRALRHPVQAAALCGVHALNTLLQGPYFDEISLSELALELNAAEAALMSEGGTASVEYQAFLLEQEEGGNVRADGMFSIQVLAKALAVWGLEAVPLSSPDAAAERAAPEREQAFIANLHEHWFTVRQLHGQVRAAPSPWIGGGSACGRLTPRR